MAEADRLGNERGDLQPDRSGAQASETVRSNPKLRGGGGKRTARSFAATGRTASSRTSRCGTSRRIEAEESRARSKRVRERKKREAEACAREVEGRAGYDRQDRQDRQDSAGQPGQCRRGEAGEDVYRTQVRQEVEPPTCLGRGR